VTLFDWQSLVGDEHFDAGPAADDPWLDVECQPPSWRRVRSAVDSRGKILSK
jgi:hypothetical protein